MVALEGTNTTLECTCSKDECKEKAATAYWKFKDHYISQSKRVKLSNATTVNGVRIIMTILNVSRIDDGEYVCGINTSLGFGEQTKRLRVLIKDSDTFPRVHATTNKVYADIQSPASLECIVTYPFILESPTTFWVFNGTLRITKDSRNYHQRNFKPNKANQTITQAFRLDIATVSVEYCGWYSCGVKFTVGQTTLTPSKGIKLEYNLIKWKLDVKDAMVALEGTNTTLECTCSKDECKEKAATAYWKFKDHYISQSNRVKLSNATTVNGVRIIMTILNVSRIDDGEYVCGINTPLGFGEETRRLRVLMKDSDTYPRVHATTNKVYADIQSPAFLKCIVTYPSILESPTTFWVFNDTLRITKDSRNYHQRDFKPNKANPSVTQAFRLDIATVSVEYYGWYSCGVEFTVGQTTVTLFTRLKLGKIGDDDEIKSGELRKTMPEESPLIAISSITAGGIILGFVVAFVAYRLCRKKRNTEEPFFETPLNGNQFRYDVFVTFSSQDFNWVKKELIPLMEKHKLNYCIHDRDFETGKPVVDNMAQSVYTSRKVLAVMSHNYMSSKFCRGELEMALYRSTELGDSSVIVMRIDGVDRGQLPKALRNRTFLDYNDFTERTNWEERLIRHLKPPPIETCTESISGKAYTLLQSAEV